LGHDELDILVLDALCVDLFTIVLLLLLSVSTVAVASVVVTGVVVLDGLVGELLGSSGLGAGVEVLNLGLTEDAVSRSVWWPAARKKTGKGSHVGVAVGRLVHLGVVDDEQDLATPVSSSCSRPAGVDVPAPKLAGASMLTHVLRAAESDAGDAVDTGEVQLLHSLASLLLVTGVDHGLGASGDAGVAGLDLGLFAAGVIELFDGGLLDLVIGEFLYSRVGHFGELAR
jgi:hypothetical protein